MGQLVQLTGSVEKAAVLGALGAYVLPRIPLLYRLVVCAGALVVLANVNFLAVSSFHLLPLTVYVALQLVLFMVASPLSSPEGMVYTAGLYGWPFAITMFAASVAPGPPGGAVNRCARLRAIARGEDLGGARRGPSSAADLDERPDHVAHHVPQEPSGLQGQPYPVAIPDYLKRAEAAKIGWPLPEGQGEKELLQLLIAHPVAGTAACPA